MALKHYVKDELKLKAICNNFDATELSIREKTPCSFVHQHTISPESHENKDYTINLREVGLSDAAILDMVLVISNFNFVNRIVLAFGVDTSAEEVERYYY